MAEIPGDWLPRLRRRLAPSPLHAREHWRLGHLPVTQVAAYATLVPEDPRPAAVLVPIVDSAAGPALLLTRRAGHLRQHAGQVSFPGGRIEASDLSPLGAALREAREEIGLDAGLVEPLGYLADHVVRTGYRITPVVAHVRAGFRVQADESEVAEVFELPLSRCQADCLLTVSREVMGVDYQSREIHHEGRVVWGATAGVIISLMDLLEEP
mgnify:CR=1 FL=1